MTKNAGQSQAGQLRRALGLFDATAISVGAIIGAGIYVVTGIVAGLAGPSLIISIILAGAIASFSALSFAQLSAHMPREGGGYEFTYIWFHLTLVFWLVGCGFSLTSSLAALCLLGLLNTWSVYFRS